LIRRVPPAIRLSARDKSTSRVYPYADPAQQRNSGNARRHRLARARKLVHFIILTPGCVRSVGISSSPAPDPAVGGGSATSRSCGDPRERRPIRRRRRNDRYNHGGTRKLFPQWIRQRCDYSSSASPNAINPVCPDHLHRLVIRGVLPDLKGTPIGSDRESYRVPNVNRLRAGDFYARRLRGVGVVTGIARRKEEERAKGQSKSRASIHGNGLGASHLPISRVNRVPALERRLTVDVRHNNKISGNLRVGTVCNKTLISAQRRNASPICVNSRAFRVV
jgi:hypothetical protein